MDETMCAWRPRQSKLGRLPNISYIIRKPEPLGTEYKTICCPITGVMTYMEIQRGKEGMKNMHLQKELGATTACTIRCAEGSHQGDTHLKAVVKGDAWFGSVKCAVELAKRGRAFVGQIKSNHSLFPKKYIEEKLKDAPGGAHIVLKGTYQEVELIAIGYRYSSKKTLHFVMTADAGSTTPGEPYEIKFTDAYGNVHVCDVDRPDVISRFFQESNCVDKHNQARQFELALEKKWLTDDAYFRLFTTLVGINVTDTWKLAAHHWLLSYRQGNNCTILSFAGILAKQLLILASWFESKENITVDPRDVQSVSDISNNTDSSSINNKKRKWKYEEWMTEDPIKVVYDSNGAPHALCQFPVTMSSKTKKKYRKNRTCSNPQCKKLSTFFCADCGTFCHSSDPVKARDKCFHNHVNCATRNSARLVSK